MMATENSYVKLPGKGVRSSIASASYCSLWLGADHLLQVDGTRFSEDYKRFYFKDIKAILVRKTNRWAITNWILFGIALFVVAFFAIWALNEPPFDRGPILVAGGCIAGFFLVCAAISLLLGPTCVCHLMTPVQLEELSSLNRLRTARKALLRIRAAVEAVQGSLSEGERQEMGAINTEAGFSSPERIPASQGLQGPPPLSSHGPVDLRWNKCLVVALLACALLEGSTIAGARGMLLMVSLGIASCALGAIIIAMLVRTPSSLSKATAWTRVAVWGVWKLIGFVFGTVASVQYSMEHPGRQADVVTIMKMLPKSYFTAMAIASGMYVIWAIMEIIIIVRAKKQAVPIAPQPSPTEEAVVSGDRI